MFQQRSLDFIRVHTLLKVYGLHLEFPFLFLRLNRVQILLRDLVSIVQV